MKTYFVTGASGAIGSALIPLLLAMPETRIVVLLRAESAQGVLARLDELFAFWQIAAVDSGARGRVRALRGDVTMPQLGLDAADYGALCAECTHVVHSAGLVRMNLPIEQARHSAIDAARHIAHLARQCPRLEKVEFVSTIGVGGRSRSALPEDWIPTPRDFHNTYEQAKAEAEALLHGECERGLPLTVHRPSMVVGDTAGGRIIHFQVFYHLCEFLSGRRTLGLAPDLAAARLDIVPADYVARAIAWSSTSATTRGRILHLCSGPQALPLDTLRARVRHAFRGAGRRLPPIISLPPRVFQGLLGAVGHFMSADNRRAIRTLPVFLDYLASAQRFVNERTQALLAGAGLPLPPPESYLDKVLGYYLASAFCLGKDKR